MGDGHVGDHADDEWGMGLDVGRKSEQMVELVDSGQALCSMKLALGQIATAESF